MAKKPVISSVATGYQATDTINNTFLINSTTLVEYADDTAAARGVQVNRFYRTGSVVKVRVT